MNPTKNELISVNHKRKELNLSEYEQPNTPYIHCDDGIQDDLFNFFNDY